MILKEQRAWLKKALHINTDKYERPLNDSLKQQLTARLDTLEPKAQKALIGADARRQVVISTPIEQARVALGKRDYDTAKSALDDLENLLKGSTAAAQPQAPSQPIAPEDADAAKEYEKIHTEALAKLKKDEKADGIATQIINFKKALRSAEQAAKDHDWESAVKQIKDLNIKLNSLPQLIDDERKAENDCRNDYKKVTELIKTYQGHGEEKQDTAVLKLAKGSLAIIDMKMKGKSFAAAKTDIAELTRVMDAAELAANQVDGNLKGKDVKSRKGKMKKEETARQEMVAIKELEIRVQAAMLGDKLGMPEVQALMNEHRDLISSEVAVFKGYRWMDDIQDALDTARDKGDDKAVKAVTKTAKDMCDAIKAAKDRQQSLSILLNSAKVTNDNAEDIKRARVFAGGMTNHIPDTWLTEGSQLAKRLPMMTKSKEDREKELTKLKDIPDEKRAQEHQLFTDVIEHGSLKGADRTQFYFDEPLRAIPRDTMDETALAKAKEAADLLAEYDALDVNLRDDAFAKEMKEKIESASKLAKGAQASLKKKRTDGAPDPKITKDLIESTEHSKEAIGKLREKFKDETNIEPATKDSGSQYERLMKTNKEMIERAYAIRDAGGSVNDVEKSMEHVPPEFWPPQFNENLQAWRKVERELGEERVQALFEKNNFNFGDAVECLSFAKELYGTLGMTSGMDGATKPNDDGGWMAVPKVASLIEGYIGQVQGGFTLGKDAVEAMETLDYSGLKAERLSDLYDNAASATNLLISGVTNIKNVPGIPEAGKFAKEVVPILSAIAAGIDLSVALNALRKSITMRVKTGRMIDEAKLEYYSGEMHDGGAMVKAIKNERDARNRQVAKKGTDVASKSVTLAGEATKSAVGSGLGTEQAVGHGLVIAGKAIEYGGKIVFAGIDWGVAQQAKKLIKEAQAGNPIARMEIMENSGLYAKMYIAILAKDGNKLALKFIDQRGYDERSVMKPSVSLQILREAMLAHADQKDETQVNDNLALELSESITGKGVTKAVKTVGKGAQALAKKIKDLPKDMKIEYDANWTPPKKPATIVPAEWQTNKKHCIKEAGLYDQSTGIDKAMKPCDALITAATTALDSYDTTTSTPEDRTKIIAQVRKAQAAISKAMQVIGDYYPGTNEGKLHQPMADYLVDLRRVLGTESNKLDQLLVDLTLIKSDWTPPKKPGTKADDWKSNWADAVTECDLPKNDGGVGTALQAFEAAVLKQKGFTQKEEIKERRDAGIEIREALRGAADAVKGLWSACTSFSGMTDYLDVLIDHIVKKSQENDKELNGFDWDKSPFKVSDDPPFTSALWTTTYSAADKMGFINRKKGDCGMEKALKAWEIHDLAKSPNTVATKELVKKRKEATKVVAEIARSAEQLAAANSDAHSDFLKYIAVLRRKAHEQVAQFAKDQNETKFAVTKKLDAVTWKTVYEAGVEAGAIPKNDKAFKELNKSIVAFTTALGAVQKAKKAKAEYAAAKIAQAKSADLQKVLLNTTSTDGWSNDLLLEYLDFVRDTAQAESEAGNIAQVINGEKRTFAKPNDFEFKNKGGWQDVKKKAVEAGLLADSKTGLGKTIDQYLAAVKKQKAAEKKSTEKPDVYKATCKIVLSRLSTIEAAAKGLARQTKNATLTAYFNSNNKGSVGNVCRKESRVQQEILDGLT